MISLTRDPIDHAALTEQVRRNDCGAVVTFLGTVRELTDGKATVALDYEAYPGMAEKKMAEIEREVRQRWPIGEVAMVHRLGHLDLGEVSVAVAVSCPHRQQAFEACKYAIDRIKEIVPIWKKENWADGSTEWVHPNAECGMRNAECGMRNRGKHRIWGEMVPDSTSSGSPGGGAIIPCPPPRQARRNRRISNCAPSNSPCGSSAS
jgi:molybdopterin synthase catalytic subunit